MFLAVFKHGALETKILKGFLFYVGQTLEFESVPKHGL